jgi:hypothetical protein
MLFRARCGFFDDGDFVVGQFVEFVNEAVDLAVEGGAE